MRVLCDVVLVGYEHDGVAFRMQPVKKHHDLVAGLGVKVSRRLIGQDDGGAVHQGAGNGHALALTA